MKKTVYFVRHGESEGNTGTTFAGPASPLTDKGREQVRLIAERAARLPAEALISSSMVRAHDTAKEISRATGLPIETSDLFVERMKPSSLNDHPAPDPVAYKLFCRWEDSLYKTDTRVEDGENFEDIKERARKALLWLERRPEEKILVVTHGVFLRTMLALILFGENLNREVFYSIQKTFRSFNVGITVFTYDDESYTDDRAQRWRVLTWNDIVHLG